MSASDAGQVPIHHSFMENAISKISKKLHRTSLGGNDGATVNSNSSRHSNDVIRQSSRNHDPKRRSIDVLEYALPQSRTSMEGQTHSEIVAERNVGPVAHTNGLAQPADPTAHTLKHKAGVAQLTSSTDDADLRLVDGAAQNLDRANGVETSPSSIHRKPVPSTSIEQIDVDKALPDTPRGETHNEPVDRHVSDALASQGINLDNSTDTTTETNTAGAVTRETVKPVVHEVQTQKVFREIHNTDVYHSILPISDVEWLPARHFVRRASGTLQEIPDRPNLEQLIEYEKKYRWTKM